MPNLQVIPRKFIEVAADLLVPDAQNQVTLEEILYSVVVYLLDQISPHESSRFMRRFDQSIGRGDPPLTTCSVISSELDYLVRNNAISSKQAQNITSTAHLATTYVAVAGRDSQFTPLLSMDEALSRADLVLSLGNPV